MKKTITIFMVLTLILALSSTTYTMAGNPIENQSSNTTTMQLNITPAQLSVEVPLEINFDIDKDGAVTAPSAISIINNSYAPVKVVSATVIQTSPWSIVSIDTDFTTKKVDTKEFAFSLEGQGAQNGISFNTTEFVGMAAKDTSTLDANKLSLTIGSVARIVPQRDAIAEQGVAEIVFVFNFIE